MCTRNVGGTTDLLRVCRLTVFQQNAKIYPIMFRYGILTICAIFSIKANAALTSDILLSSTGVVVSCRWSAGDVAHGYVEAATATNPDSASWHYLQSWSVGSTGETLSISSPLAASGRQFWRFCSWSDEDGDGLSREQEMSLFHTDPRTADTDGDGLPDDFEIALGTNPTVSDYSDAPKILVGIGHEYSTLSAAIDAASTNSVIEIQPGVYTWNGIDLPDYPIMITSPNAGRNRQVVLRGTSSGSYALGIHNGARSVIRGLYFDLSESSTLAGIWVGGNLPWSGLAGSVRIENCYFQLSQRATSYGINVYRYSPKLLVISSCVFNAINADSTRGVNLYDSNPVAIDHCSFLNFPEWRDDNNSWGISYCSSLTHLSDNSTFIPMVVKSCLFDNSFTNALPLAMISGSHIYDVKLSDCLMPTTNVLSWAGVASATNTLVASNAVDAYGILLNGSAAIDAGGPISQREFDIRGQDRDTVPDIGAAEFVDSPSLDTDGDGITDDDEALYGTNPFLPSSDQDPISDSIELMEGTNPTDSKNYCFELNIIVTNSAAEYASAKIAYFDTESNIIGGMTAITSFANIVSMPHIVVTNGTLPVLRIWSDINTNSLWDAEESAQIVSYAVTAHANTTSTSVVQSLYDSDSDGMPDLWELQHGLNPTNSADAFENPDLDGLINLHEYWTSCDPRTSDGGDTALSAAAKPIDDLTKSIQGPTNFNYYTSVSTQSIVINSRCWASTIPLQCQSPYNGTGGQERSGTLVSDRHVIYAAHFQISIGSLFYFCSSNGCVVTNKLIGSQRVGTTDIMVGLLENSMSNSGVAPAKVLPANYANYIGSGKGLPSIVMTQSDDCFLADLNSLSSVTRSVIPSRHPFCRLMQTGISGDPVFLVIDGQPIMLFEILTYNSGSTHTGFWGVVGPSIVAHKQAVQSVMDALSISHGLPTANLTEFDFSAYTRIRGGN